MPRTVFCPKAELDSLDEPSQRVDSALFASEQLSDIRDLWPLMRPEEQQRFIRLVLDCVVIDSDTGVVAGVVPNDDFAGIFDIAAEDEGSSLGVVTWRPRADSGSAGNNGERRLFTFRERRTLER